MAYLGSWKIDDVLYFYANTARFDTGVATDADSDPAYRVYENETSTPILTGVMSLLDSSNTAGFYSEAITLSAANGFEKGKQYSIYKQAAVNSVTGASHDTFQVEAEVDANVVSDKTGYSLADGAITAAVIATGAIDADAIATDAVTEIQSGLASDFALTMLINTVGSPGNFGSGSTIANNLSDIEAQTDDIGVAGAGLTVLATQASVTAVKTKTDQLTFTKAGEVDANVQSLNDTTLNGDGSVTPWGP